MVIPIIEMWIVLQNSDIMTANYRTICLNTFWVDPSERRLKNMPSYIGTIIVTLVTSIPT